MEKISTKAGLLDKLKEIRSVEMVARKGYEQDIEMCTNEEIVTTVTKIKQDEDKHIALLDELIKLLE